MATCKKNPGKDYVEGSIEIPPEIQNAELEIISEKRRTYGCDPSPDTQDEADSGQLKEKLVGLALSGGGIRSAIFSLGVMQRLAKEDCLKHVDYLSTVSGGGYIGGSLTWFLKKGFETTSVDFPYGIEKKRKEQRCEEKRKERRREKQQCNILKHLRLHGNYLTPGAGITTLSLVAAFLRGLLLNFVVFLPLTTSFLLLILCASYVDWDKNEVIGNFTVWLSNKMSFFGSLWDWCCILIYDMASRDMPGIAHEKFAHGFLFLAGTMGISFVMLNLIYLLLGRFNLLKTKYRFGRKLEKWLRYPLFLGIVFLVLGSLPYVNKWLGEYFYLIAPLIISLFAYGWETVVKSRSQRNEKVTLSVLAVLASIVLLYGVALVSYKLALWLWPLKNLDHAILLGSLLVALVTGFLVNLNYVSMHRYYRNRLMEAFMPEPNTDGKPGPAESADEMRLQDACIEHAPYHLVNTNVILVDSDNNRWRVRGGDAFLLSSKYCGSTATGWIRTANYMTKDRLTLATAMAISGAAVTPNTGAGGKGPARNTILSLIMAMLNFSLGYWVPNPKPCRGKSKILNTWAVANYFRAALHEISRKWGYKENQKLLQLSDGGHFDNLGVYELVRRKVKLIICCDGTADPEFSFTALQVLVRRIGADFGARVEFDIFNRLELLIPRDPAPPRVDSRDPMTDAYPVGGKFAKQGYIKGKIIYPDGTESTLILLKTTMIEGLGLQLKGYKGAHPDFPDQSTADQFFDEDQFDAYRELGYEIAEQMISRVNLKNLLKECE